MEVFSVNVDMLLAALDKEEIRSFILLGGNIPEIDTPEVKTYLQALKKEQVRMSILLLKLRRNRRDQRGTSGRDRFSYDPGGNLRQNR